MGNHAKITKKYINRKSQAKFMLDDLTSKVVLNAVTEHFEGHHPKELRGKLSKRYAKAKKHWFAYLKQLQKDYGKDNDNQSGKDK